MFLSSCVLDDFFRLKKKYGFGVFFVQQNMVKTTHPDGLETSGRRAYRLFCHISPMASVLLSASVKRCFVSCMRDFLGKFHQKYNQSLFQTLPKLVS